MKKFVQKKLSLGIVMVFFAFFIMAATMLLIGLGLFVFIRVFGIDPFREANPFPPFVLMLVFSIILGTALTALVSRRTLKPLREIIDATHRVAAGDFSVRIQTTAVPEMIDLTTSFNAMVKELDSIETMRSDFISNFSHEFKTPIVSIRGFARLLRDKTLPGEERDEYVEIIIQESERLAGLATSVLNLGKLESTGILTDREYFFLDEQIRRTAALLEPRWREKGLAVSLEMDSITIYSDEDLLQQVWVNLLDNAIKFTGVEGHIAITLTRREKTAVFTIADNGDGMDEHTLAHVFDKFYQADSSRAGSGNGLGLSLVKRIVTLCGGEITAHSKPGLGSSFTVALPLSFGPD